MKKTKIISIVLMMVLLLNMSALVFADLDGAPVSSPSISGKSPSIGSAIVDAPNSTLPAGVSLMVSPLSTDSDAFKIFAAYYRQRNMSGTLQMIGDITLSGGEADANTWIRVNVSGLKAGDVVTVLHLNSSNVVDEIKGGNVRVFDGYFEFHSASFSPFAFVVQRTSTAASTTATSPQTGVYA